MHGIHEAGVGVMLREAGSRKPEARMANRLTSSGFPWLLASWFFPLSLGAQPAFLPEPQFDAAAVERGKNTFFVSCGFCHGANARGGDGGPDLIRSVLVLRDEGGKQIGEFLKVGRPDRGMQAFPDLTADQVSDIATFLHREIYLAANRRTYKILDIFQRVYCSQCVIKARPIEKVRQSHHGTEQTCVIGESTD
jgi:mono/diheme cytochrome c family protein